ncbi:MAG: hypothetical protein ACR2FI_01795 [Burkholderiales bacterium]|nr:hypothetical protein [Burkholderiales bacterium]MDQ3195716.1 hypothetical protein [Pseudomonadota bacterium]
MKKVTAVLLFSFITMTITGCAMNPFADDNIYGTRDTAKDTDPTTKSGTGGRSTKDSDPTSGGRGAK